MSKKILYSSSSDDESVKSENLDNETVNGEGSDNESDGGDNLEGLYYNPENPWGRAVFEALIRPTKSADIKEEAKPEIKNN